MEKIIQFLTTDENNAYKVVDTLQNLNAKGDVDVAEIFVLQKDANGNTSVKDSKGADASNTLYGSLFGGLIGLLAGPVGFLFGTSLGALVGSAADWDDEDFQQAYLHEISKTMENGQNVVVAHVNEEWEAAINTSLSGIAEIKRYSVEEELEKLYAKQEQELQAKIDAKKAEWNQAADDKKKEAQSEIDKLEKQLKRLQNQAQKSITAQKNAYKTWLHKIKEQIKS